MVRLALAVAAVATLAGLALATELGADLVPETWQELPRLSAAVPAGEVVLSRRAYGEPSQGVYLFVQDVVLPTGTKPSKLAAKVAQVLGSKGFVAKVEGDRGGHFSLGHTTGSFRIRANGSRAQVTTCFYNERAPQRSAGECAAILKRSEDNE